MSDCTGRPSLNVTRVVMSYCVQLTRRSRSDLFVSPPKRRVFCSDKNAIIYSNKVSYSVDSWITASGAKKCREMEEMLIMPLESLQMSEKKRKQKALTLFLYSQVWWCDFFKFDFHLKVGSPKTLTYWKKEKKKKIITCPSRFSSGFVCLKYENSVSESSAATTIWWLCDFHRWVSQNLIKWENTSCYSVMWVIWPSQGRNRQYWVFSFLNVNKSVMSWFLFLFIPPSTTCGNWSPPRTEKKKSWE